MKRIANVCIVLIALVLLVSCSAKDNPDALIDTQFASEINDSSHILSPKTYSYLHNITPPLGVKPVIVAVENIKESEIGSFADDLFDDYCEKKYSGNTFKYRGVLIVASKNPELIQVRVGKTYAVYCRMKGSAAGADYLAMQQEVPKRGIDEMCPIALNNVFRDIADCRELPWYKKMMLKMSFVHIEMFMDDVASPSESFFSQFYFRPFLYLVGGVKSIFGNWILAFLFMSLVYILTKSWIEDKLNAYIIKKAKEESNTDEDYVTTFGLFFTLKSIVVFLIKLVITVPTLAAISVLSTSRMEDIYALQYAHIPSVDVVESFTQWSNYAPSLWLVLIMMAVYYLKFLFCDKGCFTYGHLPDRTQLQFCQDNRFRLMLENVIKIGYNRQLISRLFNMIFHFSFSALTHHNFQELVTEPVEDNTNETDEKGRLKKRLIDFLFLDTDSQLYKQSPALALQVNTHREALYLTFFVGLAASTVLSYTYALYFFILWTVQLLYRIVIEIINAQKKLKNCLQGFNPFRLMGKVWVTLVVFFVSMTVLYFIIAPSYTPKTTEAIAEVKKALPSDVTGLYFVSKAEGADVQGTTARILKNESGDYYMQVYSDLPVRRFELQYDEEQGLFHSDMLGDGFIIYDEQTKTITINFSDLWILNN